MPSSSRTFCRPCGHPVFAALLLGGLMVAGCTTPPGSPVPAAASAQQEAPPQPLLVPVVRYGRYTLAELTPQPPQRDLLQQVIEVAMPAAPGATVGDAMRHVLARTGYRLCDTPAAASLYSLPLPAAHLRLGPLMLRDALRVLAGPAWTLLVDDVGREVCFERAAAPGSTDATADAKRPQVIQPTEVRP